MKRPTVYVLLVWLPFLGMHGYYFLLDTWNTPHPSYLPLFCFIGVQVFALLLAVLFGAWRFVRGPRRLQTAMWLSLGFLPVFLWYSMVSLAFQTLEERRTQQIEVSWYALTSQSIAAALFDGIGRWTLPYQLEGDRVVMFYDSSIADPQGDLEKMDEFIKAEEEYLGVSMPTKIHWMRAALLGMPGVALSHLAIAEPQGKSIGTIDTHEAAHNIMGVPSASAVYAGNYPPSFLLEGWAMARSEKWDSLVKKCWQLKQFHLELTLREAVSDIYYNQTDYRLYQQGGAFVNALCEKFGPEKFLELYRHCTRKTFVQDIERIYGMSLEELDALYWHEIESHWASQRSFDKATENCSPEEKALLAEFREAYEQQVRNFDRLTANGTLEIIARSSIHSPSRDEEERRELLFQAKNGQWMRCYKKSEGTRTEIKTERIDCDLMTPDEWLCTYQYSDTENPVQQNESWRMSIPPQQWEAEQQRLKRHHLQAFRPFSLFDGWFWEPDEYLWEPPTSTVIQSVVVEDNIIVLTLTMTEPVTAELTLRIDRKQNWLLLEAQSQITLNGEPSEMLVVYEYGEPMDGVPLWMVCRC